MSENRPLQKVLIHETSILSITSVRTPIYITLKMFFLELFANSNWLTRTVLQKLFVNIPDASSSGDFTTILSTQDVYNFEW